MKIFLALSLYSILDAFSKQQSFDCNLSNKIKNLLTYHNIHINEFIANFTFIANIYFNLLNMTAKLEPSRQVPNKTLMIPGITSKINEETAKSPLNKYKIYAKHYLENSSNNDNTFRT